MTKILKSIAEYYFSQEITQFEPTPFGLTNTTCFVTFKDKVYLIRHYDPYMKSLEGLQLEMEVTSFLLDSALSFEIPSFLPTQNGDLFVTLSDGTMGALISYIEGIAPPLQTLDDAHLLGCVVGEVTARLSQYERPKAASYDGIPFTELYRLHPLANAENIASFWRQPPFPIPNELKGYYNEALIFVEASREALMSLPRQLVHHDLLVFNLLSVEGCITGVLDFDFIAVDVSFLDFAISFNHVIQMSDGSFEMAAAFVEGYAKFRTCSAMELSQIQALTRLYYIAVLHIYIGQNRAGKDNSTAFTFIANQFIKRVDWLDQNKDRIEGLLSRLL